MTYIPDPLELLEAAQERAAEGYIDEYTCMVCGKRQDCECICPHPLGLAPLMCDECAGIDQNTKDSSP